ncbi:hypothetical protein E4U32_004642 [Claviceps aff. humidiphila group G2b]|nr:hypothetical protein E4U32_004642 [Claviceps aff. humidiphila group G2b]
MYILSNGLSRQFLSQYPAESNHIFTRDQDIDPSTRYGIMLALAISSGAFFVACVGLTIALCDWRMRYLKLRQELDERGLRGLGLDKDTVRQDTEADTSGGQEASDVGEARASGAL